MNPCGCEACVRPTGFLRRMGLGRNWGQWKLKVRESRTRRGLRDLLPALFYKWGSRGTERVSVFLKSHSSLL